MGLVFGHEFKFGVSNLRFVWGLCEFSIKGLPINSGVNPIKPCFCANLIEFLHHPSKLGVPIHLVKTFIFFTVSSSISGQTVVQKHPNRPFMKTLGLIHYFPSREYFRPRTLCWNTFDFRRCFMNFDLILVVAPVRFENLLALVF